MGGGCGAGFPNIPVVSKRDGKPRVRDLVRTNRYKSIENANWRALRVRNRGFIHNARRPAGMNLGLT